MAHGITTSDSMFSVREMPWHQRKECVVLDAPPKTTLEALTASGLGWGVQQEPVYRKVEFPDPDNPGETLELFVPVQDADDTGWQLNYRSDTGAVLGIVTDEYKPVQNIEAFTFMDALLNEPDPAIRALYEEHGLEIPTHAVEWETAGSLQGGKRVWVLAKVPQHVELAGDESVAYIYCANSHDGSMAVTASATFIRIVCANTLGWALRNSETGAAAPRTFRFRHTGNLTAKFAEARKVMGMTLRYAESVKSVADSLGQVHMSEKRATNVVRKWTPAKAEEGMTDRRKANREKVVENVIGIFKGQGADGDTRGNAPGTAWTLLNAMCEHADFGRRYTKRTSQVARSFEDNALKDEALQLVQAAV
jgi:phage/plasmid-like protein (TIGR03299 family)